jgi:Arc/MetJ family transcription regulator
MRTHIDLPEDLVSEIDRRAGVSGRSRFVEEAIRERLRRDARDAVLAETAGSLKREDYPEWGSPEAVSQWVRASRREDDARLERKLGPRPD